MRLERDALEFHFILMTKGDGKFNEKIVMGFKKNEGRFQREASAFE